MHAWRAGTTMAPRFVRHYVASAWVVECMARLALAFGKRIVQDYGDMCRWMLYIRRRSNTVEVPCGPAA